MPELFSSPRFRAAASTFGPALAIVVVQMVVFPMPPGLSVQGLTIGILGALVAIGMALIYRANRILNFAQGDLGVVPATLSVILVQVVALNYFIGLFAGLVAAIVLGGVIELAIIRRFFRAPRLILTVATIGLSQLLGVAALTLPQLWDQLPTADRLTPPIDLEFTVDPLVFHFGHVIAWIVAPLALLVIAAFLRYTNVGIAVRASAERADRASLLGVPVQRLHTYVWIVAAVLSFTALFLRASITGLPFGALLSFSVLLMALAALMLGKLTNLVTIATSAVALGLLEQGVSWNSKSALLINPILGLVIVVSLLVRRTGSTRADQDDSSSWQAADEVRPIPPELSKLREVQGVRLAIAAVLAGIVVWLPTWLNAGDSLKASAVLIFGIIVLSITVLTGWAGQVSLGQMSFAAVGGAVGAVATSQWGMDLLLSLVFAGLCGSVVAIVVGLPALRLRGLYLAVTTLAFALATTSYFLNREFFDWIPTERIEVAPLFGRWDIDTPTGMYYLCLACFVVTILAVRGIRRSRTGRVLIALRENERGTQAYGVSATRAKLTAFAISGFLAAFAGALLVHHEHSFTTTLFETNENIVVFTAAVVGGLGSLAGAALGALFLKGGQWFIPDARWRLLTSAVGVLFVLLVLPGGLGGLMFRLRDSWLRWVANRRGIVVPSLVADVRVDLQDPDAIEHAEESVEAHESHGESFASVAEPETEPETVTSGGAG